MRDDGRIVALAGGFQALWPLTSRVVTHPWVLRDLESNTFTPVSARRRGTPGPHELSAVRRSGRLLARRQRVYLVQVTSPALGLLGIKSGTTVEYDIAGNRIIQRLPGIRQPNGERLHRRPDIATGHVGALLAVRTSSATSRDTTPSPDG